MGLNKSVNFSIAKLLKEKEFNEPCSLMYDEYGVLNGTKLGMHSKPNDYGKYSAPTIAEVIMWLYEKYGVWIWVAGYKRKNNRTYFDYYFSIDKLNQKASNFFSSPTEAYLAGIEYYLKKI